MFNAAGTVPVIIDDVTFAESKFSQGANDFDVCVHVVHKDDANQADWWRGEVSQNYGKGNFASMTQAEITLMTLGKIGFQGNELATLAEQIKGKETVATIKETEKDGKVYYNIRYIGPSGGDTPQAITTEAMQARISAMFGGGAAAPATAQPAPAPAAPAAANPFGGGGNPFAPKG